MSATILALAAHPAHGFSKARQDNLTLIAGEGVAGDAHCGVTVKHRSRVAVDPTQPNLRQVHLLHAELFDELRPQGFDLSPGQMGENVTTRGIDLLALPRGTRLMLGESAVLEVTGLRNPCAQIDQFQHGLLKAVLAHADDGSLIRKAGIMAIVLTGGVIHAGGRIDIALPPLPHHRLERV